VREAEFVYVVAGCGKTKVGITWSVNRRFKRLRTDGAETICAVWHRPLDAQQVEAVALALLFNGERPAGPKSEWFRITPTEAVKTVDRAIRIIESGAPLPPRARRAITRVETVWEDLAQACRALTEDEVIAEIARMTSEQAEWKAFNESYA
jgi:hypothetical protein